MTIRDSIKEIQDLRKEMLEIPWWGMTIEVRGLRAIDRAKLIGKATDKGGILLAEKFQAGLVVASCFDPATGEKIFTEQDADWILDKAYEPIDLICQTAMRLSGLLREQGTATEKNS